MTPESVSPAAQPSQPSNVLDFALHFFGCAMEEDLYRVVGEADAARLEAFLEAYRSFASRGRLHAPPIGEGELRPYFPTQGIDLAAWARGGVDLDLHSLSTSDGMWQAVDELKHRLLYCHSLAVDDPFPHLAALAAAQTRLGNQGTRAMDALQNYVNFLLHFGALVRSHIVCLMSPGAYVPALSHDGAAGSGQSLIDKQAYATTSEHTLESGVDEMMRVAADDIRRQWQEHRRTDSGRALLRKVVFETACDRIRIAFDAISSSVGRVSAYLPFRYDVDILTSLTSQAPQDRVAVKDADNWLLARLIDIELPGLAQLDPDDLVSIRLNSEAFEEWRRTLRETLMRAEVLPANLRDRGAGVKQAVADTLQEAKRRIEESLAGSKFLAGARAGSVAMLGGAVSVGLIALVNPATTAIAVAAALAGAAGAAAVTAAAAASAGEARHASAPAQRAIYAHYVAMLR